MTTTATKQSTKDTIIAALYAHVAQRPGLEFGNYGDIALYRSEMRAITKQRHDAEAMIRYCHIRDSITADDLRHAMSGGGRLTWAEDGNGGGRLEYCTGQYWCTEYRAAVSRALSGVLWDRFREDREGKPTTGDDIRAAARRELGAPIARRWFA